MSIATCGCVGPLSYERSSVSLGSPASGALRHPEELPIAGDGYRVGEPWRRRESQFATDEVVDSIVRVARAIERADPHATLAIGDLSRRAGGLSLEHRSHQSGRDFDVFLPAVDAAGRMATPGNMMIHFDRSGRAARWSAPFGTSPPATAVPTLRMDSRRAWQIVRRLLEQPGVEVQWIFVQRDLAALILAQAAGGDAALAARAAFVVRQPSDSEPHDDHMHVRVFCDPQDRSLGCIDKGPVRWWKKLWKFMAPPFEVGREPDLASPVTRILRTRVPIAPVEPGASS